MGDFNIPSRYNWFSRNRTFKDFNVKNISRNYEIELMIFLQRIFEYDNLPNTITKRDLEFILDTNGFAIFTTVNDSLYAFAGGLGGEPNPYYLPTLAIVANPSLNFNKTLVIDKDCVVMRNNSFYSSLTPLVEETAYLLAQCDVSFKFSAVNSRTPSVITTPSRKTKAEAEVFMSQIEDGGKLSILGDSPVLGLDIKPYSAGDTNILSLIELRQYIFGTFMSRIGLKAQYNMKREAINEAESLLNEDVYFPRIDDMLENREEALDKINKMFGTNITVKKSKLYDNKEVEKELEIDLLRAEIDDLESMDEKQSGGEEDGKQDL